MKKIFILFVIIAIAALIGFQACHRDTDPNVYAAGYYLDTGDGFERACYWKNGKFYDLHPQDAEFSRAESVFVYGENAYITGNYYYNGRYRACYWVNTNFIPLVTENETSVGHSIYVKGGIVYIAGAYGDHSTACYWVDNNGVISRTVYSLPSPSDAYSIFVDEAMVFTAGTFYTYPNAFFMNDNDHYNPLIELKGPADPATCSGALSTTLKNSIFYTAGYYYEQYGTVTEVACYWKDMLADKGPELIILEGYHANSIAVGPNNRVYLAGFYQDNTGADRACYWDYDTLFPLELTFPQKNSKAESVTVLGNDVYIAGHYLRGDLQDPEKDGINTAVYWKNGTPNSLIVVKPNKGTFALSIAVKD